MNGNGNHKKKRRKVWIWSGVGVAIVLLIAGGVIAATRGGTKIDPIQTGQSRKRRLGQERGRDR